MDLYLTRDELRNEPYNISTDEADDKFLEVLQEATKEFIDTECKQDFLQTGDNTTPVERKFDGKGGDIQFLNYRLITLKEVRVYSSDTAYTKYSPSEFIATPTYIQWKQYGGSSRFGIAVFEQGIANIGVVGIWGWTEPPKAIKFAQGKLILKQLKEGSLAQKQSSENIGDYSYTLAEVKNSITGDPEIDMLLKPFIRWSWYVA